MNEQRPDRESLLELVALHALGVLPPAEHTLVTAFLLDDDEARREWRDLRAAANAVGVAAEEPVDSTRSARMKERLMGAVQADGRRNVVALEPRRAVARGGIWGAALAAAAAIVFALATSVQNFSLRGDLATTQRRVAALQDEVARGAQARAAERRVMADLVAGDGKHFAVAQGDVIVRGDRIILAMRALPALPRGKVYQAWTRSVGSTAVSPSVTFVPDRGGVAVVALPERAAGVNLVALSVEPERGSKQPTSQPAFVRPLS